MPSRDYTAWYDNVIVVVLPVGHDNIQLFCGYNYFQLHCYCSGLLPIAVMIAVDLSTCGFLFPAQTYLRVQSVTHYKVTSICFQRN